MSERPTLTTSGASAAEDQTSITAGSPGPLAAAALQRLRQSSLQPLGRRLHASRLCRRGA